MQTQDETDKRCDVASTKDIVEQVKARQDGQEGDKPEREEAFVGEMCDEDPYGVVERAVGIGVQRQLSHAVDGDSVYLPVDLKEQGAFVEVQLPWHEQDKKVADEGIKEDSREESEGWNGVLTEHHSPAIESGFVFRTWCDYIVTNLTGSLGKAWDRLGICGLYLWGQS
jgi:hypothetical protein